MRAPEACFHCALPVPPGTDYVVEIDGSRKRVCCPGCKAVAELIVGAGMENYYSMRDAPAPGIVRPEADSDEWRIFDRDDMFEAFTRPDGKAAVATIYVAGMYCSACTWLVESTLARINGVLDAAVNPLTHRVSVRFAREKTGLGRLLASLSDLGYKPQPLTPEADQRPEVEEERKTLKRLLVASLGMMQVMMFAVGLYVGEFKGISPSMQQFLRLVSFVVATPVVFYSARPFFTSAIRGVVARRPGMDLPVSLAIGAAYVASVWSMLTGGAAVWFDSVTMFVFFLTLARFLEMRARHRSIDRAAAMSTLLPNTATRLVDGQRETVPVSRLVAGDTVLVRPGEAVPADGVVTAGTSSVDEAIVSGESEAVHKHPGEPVVAGSTLIDGALQMRVSATGVETTLGTIGRLSERARHTRPGYVRLADRIAGYVVVATLIIAAAVASAWALIDSSRAFEITLSVLVITCPCALALATPAAFAAAGGRLAELRLLVTNGNAVEALARADHAIFDKTGTLTLGRPSLRRVQALDERYTAEDCVEIAAALEADSTHPIARAFDGLAGDATASDSRAVAGAGIGGRIDGAEWRLGVAGFVAPQSAPGRDDAGHVWLGREGKAIARFELDDAVRTDAADTLGKLREMGFGISLASGDGRQAVDAVARELGIEDARANCRPDDKLALIRARQERGEVVLMVGDGINDAPVLAGADVSIAPAHAAELAQTSADIIMLGDSLAPVVTAVRMAKKTMRIVRQNLTWAIVYNGFALPLAAAGFVPPWLAAIGMSSSSLVVVLNALRLSRFEPGAR